MDNFKEEVFVIDSIDDILLKTTLKSDCFLLAYREGKIQFRPIWDNQQNCTSKAFIKHTDFIEIIKEMAL